jgi:bifunctional non-homologous end joining protein LigD
MAARSGPLAKYHQKRDFGITPEPRGKKTARAKLLRFVVQKHHASRMHYDFRLEAGGVLASWAVPKGPSLDTHERRLAMHVEDHPMDYRSFEGTIPKGQYGAGSVIVWDEGTYTLAEGTDPVKEIAKGKIKFVMAGHRLRGMFSLVKIKGREGESGDPWLLIKDRDEHVDTSREITDEDTSVVTGKTLEQIAADPRSATWQSKPTARAAAKPKRGTAKRDRVPTIVTPMLATTVDEAFDNDDWLFEIKWDGYRAICTVDERGGLKLVSRNGLDLLARFPDLTCLSQAFGSLPIVVDGEIVSLDDKGRSSFGRLQNWGDHREPLTFVAFDLLYADGRDLRKEPLERRKELLKRVIVDDGCVMYSKHVVGKGIALFEQAAKLGLEGIIGKKIASTYQERRTRDWVKIKAQNEQEFVVGGWTDPRGSRRGFGALLLGVYEGDTLRPVGSVGTGFDANTLRDISAQLLLLERKTSPFDRPVVANATAHWVKPELVAQVRFAEWTGDGQLRQPAFLGLRIDKAPREVVAEQPSGAADPPSAASKSPISTKVDGRSLAFTNLDKVLWPRDGYTKGDLIGYYERVARWVLPYLRDRLLTLERFPNGIDASSFYEKQMPKGMPEWVARKTIDSHGSARSKITYVVCNDAASLAYLANLAAIVLHPWVSRVDSLDEPDYMLFDLDPGERCTLKTLAQVALCVRDQLAEIGLTPLVKTSGASGLHVILPLAAGYTYDTLKIFSELIAHRVSDEMGTAVTLQRTIAKRSQEAVYFDYLQVGRGKTLVPPYVVRARDGAPVSVPLEWGEVEAFARSRQAQPWHEFAKHTIANVPERLERDGDPWSGRGWKKSKLEPAIAKARKNW